MRPARGHVPIAPGARALGHPGIEIVTVAEEEDQAATGSERDFGALVAAETPGLRRYALCIVGKRGTAGDLVSATVVRALERRSQYRADASLRTWLHHILCHLAIDIGRHASHEVSVADVEILSRGDDSTLDPSVVLERAQSAEAVRDALVHLPYGYRSVVVLRDAEGWSSGETAEMLGISLPAAKQRLRRGRMMLVSALRV